VAERDAAIEKITQQKSDDTRSCAEGYTSEDRGHQQTCFGASPSKHKLPNIEIHASLPPSVAIDEAGNTRQIRICSSFSWLVYSKANGNYTDTTCTIVSYGDVKGAVKRVEVMTESTPIPTREEAVAKALKRACD
jgi:hypothetical protein